MIGAWKNDTQIQVIKAAMICFQMEISTLLGIEPEATFVTPRQKKNVPHFVHTENFARRSE